MPYGSGMAEGLVTDLAARGLVYQQREARGIDTSSHRRAIAARGKTIAVRATGIDVAYAKENTHLAEQILALRARAKPRCLRGSRNVTNKNSWDPNTLIKQVAKLVATWEDLWEERPTEVQVNPQRAPQMNLPSRRAHLYSRTAFLRPTNRSSSSC